MGIFRSSRTTTGSAVGAVGVFAAIGQIIQRFRAIADYDHLVGQVMFFQGGEGEFDIPLIVFSQEYAFQWSHVNFECGVEVWAGKR